MGRYDSHKNPLQYTLNRWAGRRVNNSREQEPKSIPCHVTKVEKDFVHVAFDTANSIFTPPVMKMTQSFSRFGREPTQVGDRALAVPGDYYLGGNTGYSGGRTNFYPRGNLSSLSFQPMANLKAPQRDYDQHHETGGPNGWKVKVIEEQQQGGWGQQNGGSGGSGNGSAAPSAATMRAHAQIMQRRSPIMMANGSSGGSSSSSNGQSQQQKKQTSTSLSEFSFDKDDVALMRSRDNDHYVRADAGNGQVMVHSSQDIHNTTNGGQIVLDPGSGKVYLGGDPKKDRFCAVITTCGPSRNVYAVPA
jgi:hypothetical protein